MDEDKKETFADSLRKIDFTKTHELNPRAELDFMSMKHAHAVSKFIGENCRCPIGGEQSEPCPIHGWLSPSGEKIAGLRKEINKLKQLIKFDEDLCKLAGHLTICQERRTWEISDVTLSLLNIDMKEIHERCKPTDDRYSDSGNNWVSRTAITIGKGETTGFSLTSDLGIVAGGYNDTEEINHE